MNTVQDYLRNPLSPDNAKSAGKKTFLEQVAVSMTIFAIFVAQSLEYDPR